MNNKEFLAEFYEIDDSNEIEVLIYKKLKKASPLDNGEMRKRGERFRKEKLKKYITGLQYPKPSELYATLTDDTYTLPGSKPQDIALDALGNNALTLALDYMHKGPTDALALFEEVLEACVNPHQLNKVGLCPLDFVTDTDLLVLLEHKTEMNREEFDRKAFDRHYDRLKFQAKNNQ